MPWFSTASIASRTIRSSSSSLSASSATSTSCEWATVIRLAFFGGPPNAFENISDKFSMPICAPGMPGMSKVGSCMPALSET